MEPLRGFESISYWKYLDSNILILGEQHLPYSHPNMTDLVKYYLNSGIALSYFIEDTENSQGPVLRSPLTETATLLRDVDRVYKFDIRTLSESFRLMEYKTYSDLEQYIRKRIEGLINTGNRTDNENLQRWSNDVLDDWRDGVSKLKRGDYLRLLESLTVDVNLLNIFLTTLPQNAIIVCGNAHKFNIDDFFSSFRSDSVKLVYKRDDIQGRRIDLANKISNVFFK